MPRRRWRGVVHCDRSVRKPLRLGRHARRSDAAGGNARASWQGGAHLMCSGTDDPTTYGTEARTVTAKTWADMRGDIFDSRDIIERIDELEAEITFSDDGE